MRLDEYLVKHQYVRSRSKAKDLVDRGLVKVDGKIAAKAGMSVSEHEIKVHDENEFVSRSGQKLLHVLLDYHIDLSDKIVIDVGSSTGGFTDCALRHGAKLVYAYDVGKDQMDSMLKTNRKIVLNEGTNILDVDLPEADYILIDVSFTSVKPILNHIRRHPAFVIVLVKPQFEAGRIKFKGGVLKDLKIHKDIVTAMCRYVRTLGYGIKGLDKAKIKGKSGNQEYVLLLDKCPKKESFAIKQRIGEVVC
jgi:23S rRNA (cytidine1920-2'-O)/16S rRNA (cytidine1409-2'-O)-methyltransferase